jgi:hypothetical protein
MWNLSGNEKTQEQLDAYKRKLMFSKKSTIKTITLASVIWRMVFKQEHTYYTAENGTQSFQCNGGRSRSVEDMYSVAKNYVKNVTREKVEIAIDKLMRGNLISQSFCSDIRRRVHSPLSLNVTLTKVKNILK